MRKLLAAAAVTIGAALFAPVASPAAPTVRVGDNWFKPKVLTVAQHSTVMWRFVGHKKHNVTVTKGPVHFHSPTRSSGLFLRHFMRRGTYKIVCTIHKQKMTVKVT